MSDNLRFDDSSNTLTVSHVEGVDYMIGGRVVNGEEVKLTRDTFVTARPQPGKVFPSGTQTRWKFEVNKDVVAQERAETVEAALAERESANQQVATASEPVATDRDAPRDVPSGPPRPAVNPTADLS